MRNPVVHFEVLGKDADALKRFYGDTFEWELESIMPTYAMIRPADGESGIPGGIGAGPQDSPGHVTFYIEVDDLHATLEKITAQGGSTLQPPMDIPDGPSIALFSDPEGHVIGLVKSR